MGANESAVDTRSVQAQVAVVLNPEYKPAPAGVYPDAARVVWKRKDGIVWTLLAEDENARIEAIVFDFVDERRGPFEELEPVPGSNKRQWRAAGPRKGNQVYKYTVHVVDGRGQKYVIDPFVVSGDRP